ncbi:hypothetical protein QAD02_003993 [Eretmocerus hayati]|uniref:Uncharacterized protein n=1 Tax=Eretmocerus hayati TaxID=131215 RepID=A0ACC2NPE0_9HYME|nr:hypothetical protein QAD02_003993 [Eretmocerus hayati]
MSQAKEITLPVPWGHVSAKAWGSPEHFPVLCVHGILDNGGAFDRLISFLPKHYYYIAVDLPGHGFSSHFPLGIQLNFFDYLLTLRYIVKKFQWKNFMYLGHSLGGQLGAFYCLVYPNEIEKLVLVEGLAPKIFSHKELIPQIRKIHDTTIKLQKNDAHKHCFYTRSEIMYALQFNRAACLNKNAAEALFKRSVSPIGGLYEYNRDVRLKYYTSPLFDLDQIICILSQLKVDILFFVTKGTLESLSDYRKSYLTQLPKHYSGFKVIYIGGNHDVHNNHPERICNDISEFLDKDNLISKL